MSKQQHDTHAGDAQRAVLAYYRATLRGDSAGMSALRLGSCLRCMLDAAVELGLILAVEDEDEADICEHGGLVFTQEFIERADELLAGMQVES